jgi:hypothetical protein
MLQPGGQPAFGMPGFDWNAWAAGLIGAGMGAPGSDPTITVTGQRLGIPGMDAAAGGGVGAVGLGGPQMSSLGLNLPTAQLALSGLSTLGSLWGAFQQNNLANKAFKFQRDYANTNLRNQTQSYNTQMEDRIGSRAFVQGMSADQANAYLSKHRLTLPASAQDPSKRG